MDEPEQQFSLDPVTADDVAAAAGVSRWTVARAFKTGASISERSRKKVMEAAAALGYAPDLLAASLASDRSNLVALLVDDFDNPHKLVMLERLTRILRIEGWGALLVNMLDEADASSALLTASQRRVDAAILIGTQFDDEVMNTALGARRVKKLIVFARVSPNPQTISICCDDVAAMREIASYVLAKGYERPLFLAGPDTQSAMLMRKEAFLAYWRSRQHVDPQVVHVPEYNMALAYERLTDTLRALPDDRRPDVVVAENDILAIGAMDAIRHGLDLDVPHDIGVTGFDDIPLSASPGYDLTTFRQPISEMTKALVEVLRSDGKRSDPIFFRGKFIARGSA